MLAGVVAAGVWAHVPTQIAAAQTGAVPPGGSTSAVVGGAVLDLADLQQQVREMVSDPAVNRAHWGVMVTALDGTPIVAVNEGQLFQPASNAKLYTTAAALALLGADSTVATVVTGALEPSGTVVGDLTLVGGGDANFDSGDLPYIPPAERPKPSGRPARPRGLSDLKDINSLADQLVAKGLKRVEGDVVGDDTLFPWEPYAPDWALDNAVWGFGAPVSALTISDNQLRLTIRAGEGADVPGTVLLEQAVPYYTVRAEVSTVQTKAEATGVQVERLPGSRVLRVYGSMAVRAEADVEEVAIDDPAEYAAMTLKAALIERGVAIRGDARASHREVADGTGFLVELHRNAPADEAFLKGEPVAGACLQSAPQPDVKVLATHTSAPLEGDLIFTNKVSQNLHAELLLHRLARIVPCSQGSTVAGAGAIRAFWSTRAGLDPRDFIFYDGSGLSGHDLTTPRATAKLLSYAAHDPTTEQPQPWFPQWRASLPVAGEDGSLAGRFKATPLKDHVFAKTGTLSEARALSGYLECASGRTVIFSIMVGDFVPGTTEVRETLDRMVSVIAAAL